MKIRPLLGPCGKLPILIRDDDTNFFTKEGMLESVYAQAWNKGFKISLSVIPSVRGFDEVCVPPNSRKTGILYPITNNEGLIRFIKDKLQRALVEILLHGFSHGVVKGYRGEFGINSPDREGDLISGISIIRDAFDIEPRFFVPSYDDISYKNLEMIKQYQMLPIYGDGKIHGSLDRRLYLLSLREGWQKSYISNSESQPT